MARRATHHKQDRTGGKEKVGVPKAVHQQQRRSLQDRMTRDVRAPSEPEQEQGCEPQAAKRKRGEGDSGLQQQKKARTEAHGEGIASAMDIKSLKGMSEAEKMASRRARFAKAPGQQKPKPASGCKADKTPRVAVKDDRVHIAWPNPACTFAYQPYNGNGVLLLASEAIAHEDSLANESDYLLNRQAMEMYERGWQSADFGRGPVNKALPVRVINDCDLYLRADKMIYVASEMGLVLASEYCKLAGIPDDQAIRFEGRKPRWAKLAEANRHFRLVKSSFDAESSELKDYYELLGLDEGGLVEVYERFRAVDDSGKIWDVAYGRRTEDSVRGIFDYGSTCRTGWGVDPEDDETTPKPAVVDWVKFDYATLAETATRYQRLASTEHKLLKAKKELAEAEIRFAAKKAKAAEDKKIKASGPDAPATITTTTVPERGVTTVNEAAVEKSAAYNKTSTNDAEKLDPIASRDEAESTAPHAQIMSVAQGPNEAEKVEISCREGHIAGTSTDDTNTIPTKGGIPETAAAESTPARPVAKVNTIRRKVGPNQYVEEAINYDDDDEL